MPLRYIYFLIFHFLYLLLSNWYIITFLLNSFKEAVTDGDKKSDRMVLSNRYIDSLRVEVFRFLFLLAVLDKL